jgi:hypothetical protein
VSTITLFCLGHRGLGSKRKSTCLEGNYPVTLCFKEQDDVVKYFLCELYLHNFILEENIDENPNPFTRDI